MRPPSYWLAVDLPPEKYELVSWGYYSQYMEKHVLYVKNMFQTTNQIMFAGL